MNSPHVTLLRPVSLSPDARNWVLSGSAARVLHVFSRSCNLVDGKGRILSLVSREIGDGPFNAVFSGTDLSFQEMVDPAARVGIDTGCVQVGALVVDFRAAPVWDPRPDWAQLHDRTNLVRHRLGEWIAVGGARSRLAAGGSAGFQASWQARLDRSMLDAGMELAAGVYSHHLGRTAAAARALAGLGAGLTPAGDDILVGSIYAARILHGSRGARALAGAIMAAARGRTTSLSSAWLQAAARGEASVRWHHFLASLLQEDRPAFETSAAAILATGHTSGAAAMQGFVAVLLPGLLERPAGYIPDTLLLDSVAGSAQRPAAYFVERVTPWRSGFSPRAD